MKLRVDPAGDTALVRGKLWPRGKPEPTDWTIQMRDEAPNLFGSPGLLWQSPSSRNFMWTISVFKSTSNP